MSTIQETQITRIPPRQVEQAAAKQPIDLLDVRTPGEYAAVHATGARLVPLSDLDPHAIIKSRKSPPRNTHLPDLQIGPARRQGGGKICRRRLADVSVVEGGTDAWVAAGLPVIRGKGVISLERQVHRRGHLVVAGVVLAWTVHPWFTASPPSWARAWFAGITDTCGMAMMLAKCPGINRTAGPLRNDRRCA